MHLAMVGTDITLQIVPPNLIDITTITMDITEVVIVATQAHQTTSITTATSLMSTKMWRSKLKSTVAQAVESMVKQKK